MSTEVLLMSDVKDLGNEGDIVTVADGYARNFLFPKKIGATVSDATRRQLAKNQVVREAERATLVAEARERAEKLSGVSCTIAVKTDDEDKMYALLLPKTSWKLSKPRESRLTRQAFSLSILSRNLVFLTFKSNLIKTSKQPSKCGSSRNSQCQMNLFLHRPAQE